MRRIRVWTMFLLCWSCSSGAESEGSGSGAEGGVGLDGAQAPSTTHDPCETNDSMAIAPPETVDVPAMPRVDPSSEAASMPNPCENPPGQPGSERSNSAR